MKTIKILTPENIELDYTIASLGIRLVAAFIDWLIQMGLFVIMGVVLLIIFGLDILEGAFEKLNIQNWVLAIMIIIAGFIIYGYYIIFDILLKGQTPGKRIFNLRIIRENGQPITAIHAIIRELIRITIDPLLIGCLLIFFNKKGKRLGDLAASTIVIEEKKEKIIQLASFENDFIPKKKYPISQDEYVILNDFLLRKDTIDSVHLEREIQEYFIHKYNIDDDYNRNLLVAIYENSYIVS